MGNHKLMLAGHLLRPQLNVFSLLDEADLFLKGIVQFFRKDISLQSILVMFNIGERYLGK